MTRGQAALRGRRATGDGSSTGRCPLWRRLGPQRHRRRDVEQLERNLVELGHDPQRMTVDETFDDDTAAAVRSWQEALGLPETGAVEPRPTPSSCPGPRRIGQHETTVGAQLQPGNCRARGHRHVAGRRDRPRRAQPRSSHASARRCGSSSRRGARVTGTVASVGRVAETLDHRARARSGDPTVSVVVRLADPGERDGLDGAPVIVSLERDRARNVLAVPSRRCSRSGAAETRSSSSARTASGRSTAVETGTFADGYVEVDGRGIRTGARVVVPE